MQGPTDLTYSALLLGLHAGVAVSSQADLPAVLLTYRYCMHAGGAIFTQGELPAVLHHVHAGRLLPHQRDHCPGNSADVSC